MPPKLKTHEHLRWKVECLYKYNNPALLGCILVYRIMLYNGLPVIHILSAMEIPPKRLSELLYIEALPLKNTPGKIKPKPDRTLPIFTQNEVTQIKDIIR